MLCQSSYSAVSEHQPRRTPWQPCSHALKSPRQHRWPALHFTLSYKSALCVCVEMHAFHRMYCRILQKWKRWVDHVFLGVVSRSATVPVQHAPSANVAVLHKWIWRSGFALTPVNRFECFQLCLESSRNRERVMGCHLVRPLEQRQIMNLAQGTNAALRKGQGYQKL